MDSRGIVTKPVNVFQPGQGERVWHSQTSCGFSRSRRKLLEVKPNRAFQLGNMDITSGGLQLANVSLTVKHFSSTHQKIACLLIQSIRPHLQQTRAGESRTLKMA
jgi:hypothetical protein